VASARIEKTQCCIFSADESAGVGKDMETTVSEAYTSSTSHFSGKIDKVTINLK
jgi:arylsulfatase